MFLVQGTNPGIVQETDGEDGIELSYSLPVRREVIIRTCREVVERQPRSRKEAGDAMRLVEVRENVSRCWPHRKAM